MKEGLIIIILGLFSFSCDSKKDRERERIQEPEMKMEGMDADELHVNNRQIQLGHITTDSLREHVLGEEFLLTGIVKVNQNKVTAVSSRVMGRIEKLYFKNIGETIAAGEPIYEIYSEELNMTIKEFLLANEKHKNLKNEQVNLERLAESGKAKLRLFGLTDKQINDLRLDDGNEITVKIVSPAAGIITSVDRREGEYVMEGGDVYHLVDLSTVWVEGEVYSDYQKYFNEGLMVDLTFPGLLMKKATGKISFVNPELNQPSKINLVRVEVSNEKQIIKPGMQANIIVLSHQKKSLAIPTDAVIIGEKGASVWIKTGENRYKSKMVHTGLEAGNFTEITYGLKKGDQVVITGAYLLHSEFINSKGTSAMEGHDMSKM